MFHFTNQQITMFFAVAEFGRLSDAARAMYVTQPSLSKTLARLETNLGVRLFDRQPDGMILTKEGEYLYNSFKASYNQIRLAIDRAKDMQKETRPTLNIGLFMKATNSVDFEPAAKAIAEYKQKYPEVRVNEEIMSFRDLRHNLTAGNLDIIVTLSYVVKNMFEIEIQKLSVVHWCIAMPDNHPLAQKDELDTQKLSEETFLMLTPDETQSDKAIMIERCCVQHGFLPKEVIYMQNEVSILRAVSKGVGICISAQSRDKMPGVKEFLLPEFARPPYVIAAWKKRRVT